MPARTTRAPVITLALLSSLSLLAACGGSGGGSGGSGGGGGNSATTTSGGTTTTTTTSSGPGCMELCTELNKCPNIPMSDCAADCPDADVLIDGGMCREFYKSAVACILASPDPCNASDNDCITQYAEFVSCTEEYCDGNPSAPGCQ